MSSTFEQAFRSQLSSWRGSTQNSGSLGLANNSTAGGLGGDNNFMDRISSWNPFKGTQYVSLPISESGAAGSSSTTAGPAPPPLVVEEPSWFTLSRWDRLLVFGVCLLGAVACFALCFVMLPILAMRPRKFAVLWTLGSVLFIISFGVLQGPMGYLVHLVSATRLPFTIAYFGSIVMTLVFSIGLRSTLLTILAAVVQIIAAIWYTVSYFPLGSESLKFVSRVGARQVTSWINS